MRSKFHIYSLNKMTRKVLRKLGETFLVENIKDFDIFWTIQPFFYKSNCIGKQLLYILWTVSLKLFIKVVRDTMRGRYYLKTIELL